ncbi:erythromycin esterase family protein [Streptomyces sp. NPDC058171]
MVEPCAEQVLERGEARPGPEVTGEAADAEARVRRQVVQGERAMDDRTGQYGVFSTGPAAPGSNEHTLDRVRHRDYYVDLREAGRDPAVGGWLSGSRPTFVVPGSYPNEPLPVSLGRTFDVLVHLHRVRASVPVD